MSSIEEYNERLENAESQLKQKLRDFHEYMPVRMENGGKENVTLLQIYGERMDYLVKNKNKDNVSNLLDQWKSLLVTYNVNVSIKLIMEFFKAKRNYRTWQTSGNYKQDSFWMCQIICEKIGLYWEDDLVNRLFSSYSAAEKRIRRKVKEWKVLSDTSKSLLESLSSTNEKEKKADWKQEDKNPKNTDEKQSLKWKESNNRDGIQLTIDFSGKSVDEPEQIKKVEPVQDKPSVQNKSYEENLNLDDVYDDNDEEDYEYEWQKRNNK